ncbi:AAA family ATPase [Bacillus cereus]|uniref:AAA family ATPase n=1 Tax=Bacillus mycoides TaxID=1405 RepID=UPI001A32DA23|nr:AAA family ATPase [Bacillus mycoides]MBJ7997738.1 AAA family ATPase [Bacillus cereus]
MSNVKDYKKLLNMGIQEFCLSGYKSFYEERKLEIKPLTILAGPNSTGKSSVMQPLLLMKQTLEEGYDPGTLLLNGTNVKFTKSEQLLFKNNRLGLEADFFSIGIKCDGEEFTKLSYIRKTPGFRISEMSYSDGGESFVIKQGMSSDLLKSSLPKKYVEDYYPERIIKDCIFSVERDRCFLKVVGKTTLGNDRLIDLIQFPLSNLGREIRSIIHLPGLRGNPERNYPTTSLDSDLGRFVPGTFEKYVASIIVNWQENHPKKINSLNNYLRKIGLTKKITAKYINDTEVGLFVTSSLNDIDEDLVSIADVGLGVSQTLPILVALLFAERGQMVYIEQPEIHLHPRAQFELASIIAEAANRGVKVVIETHSSLFLRGLQTVIALKKLPKELTKIHWFSKRKDDGVTEVHSVEFDDNGAFGDWPDDFDNVEYYAEQKYLDAVEKNYIEGKYN